MAVVYDKPDNESEPGEKPGSLSPDLSRPNGSLYSRQKRQIADACEWLRIGQSRERKALIFVLTSPGFTSLANQPKFISAFTDNMRKNYGMGDYVWVREHTKRGYPHFHFVAHWHPSKWFFDLRQDAPGCEPYTNIEMISRYWSSLFDSDSKNSVRLGTYKGKKRTGFYLTDARHAWYLTKYLGKSIGHGSIDYLCEAGFPFQVNSKDGVKMGMYKKAVRGFGMSENCALLSHPVLFDQQYIAVEQKEVTTIQLMSDNALSEYRKTFPDNHISLIGREFGLNRVELTHNFDSKERVFISPVGQLSEYDIKKYDWRWTGHGNTFIGMDQDRKKYGKGR